MECEINELMNEWVKRPFSFTKHRDWLWGPTQSPNQCMPVSPSLMLKCPRHDTDRSPPSSAEVTSDYISNPLYASTA